VDLLPFFLDKNNLFIGAVAIVSGMMLAFPVMRRGRSAGTVNTTEAIQRVNRGEGVWVDLRPAEQFQAGHIAQARNMPLDEMQRKAGTLPKNKLLVLICEQGRDSARAIAELRRQGFAEVAALEGGMRAWNQAGLPVTRKN
jgi:rhodanese-related sulfurtransferase